MSFKPKAQKKIKIDKKSIITVDNKHEEFLNKFEKNESLIDDIECEISSIKSNIEKRKYKNIEHRLTMLDRIKYLYRQKNNLKNERNKYFLSHSKNIFDYFENKKQIGENSNSKKTLHNFFYKTTKPIIKNDTMNDSSKKYLMCIDSQFIDINNYTENYEKCKNCNGELVIIDYEGIMVCNRCSFQEKYLIEHEKPSYKEPPKEVDSYAYKRINHFREILAQFQAKESTQIDETIIQQIKDKVKKERITIDKLTNEKTKQILKNLGYNKYYEHIPFIKEKLGIRPPTMPIELETKLCNLFLEIQQPYAKFCPVQRVNFLNYYYVLYKLCELLDEDSYLQHFYMLKDPVKRMEQDEIWKKICAELNWEFIPTP